MKYTAALFALFATSMAMPTVQHGGHDEKDGSCGDNKQTVVCNGQGNGGLLSLGNILPGLLGENCSAGDVYCCSGDEVNQVCYYPIFEVHQTLTGVAEWLDQPQPRLEVQLQPVAVMEKPSFHQLYSLL